MAKKITLEMLAAQMADGFAKQGKEIRDLTESVAHVVKHMATKDDIADVRRELKGDIADVRQDMATKDDVRTIVREETNDMRDEVASMRRDLNGLTEKVDNLTGLPKEIDHALERIAAIEKHPAIRKHVA